MAKSYWLTKSEPFKYPWEQLLRDKRTSWDGVRSFEARNNLRAMKAGDLVLFYHSSEGREVVGVAKVEREAYPDPTADAGDWLAIELSPLKTLKKPVGLSRIKEDKKLANTALLRRSRLSVVPLTPAEFARILELSETEL